MVLLFGLYWFLLRKEKLFRFNRYYLIFSVLLALIVPLVNFSVGINYTKPASNILTIINYYPGFNTVMPEADFSNREIVGDSGSVPLIEPSVAKKTSFDPRSILIFIYLAGFTLMLIRFCRNILMINRLFRRSEKIDHNWYKVALLDHPVNPFSFLRTVFFCKQDYLDNRIASNVLKHELEHIRQAHSYDVIYFEILHLIFWFNPVLFFYKQAAKINHEYLADEAVIRSFSDLRTYGNELINFVTSRVNVPFTSGFNPSMIRLRLLMLNTSTSKQSKNLRMIVALLISFSFLALLSFRPASSVPNDAETVAGKKDKQDDIVIKDVYFRGTDFKPLKALIAVNGKILNVNDVFSFDPQQIKTIEILNDRKAKRRYGKEGIDGVVEISTYGSDTQSMPDSLKWKSRYTVNQKVPEGTMSIPVSNLYSLTIWNYPVFPNQDPLKRWRTIEVMTRDYYKIQGKVIRKDGEPISGAILSAEGNPKQIITGMDGRFLLEDVKSDALAELSAEGYEPLYFKVNGVVFRSNLKITLGKKNESEWNNLDIVAGKNIKDFTGKWILNKELSKTPFPSDYVYNIRQFDSDSIQINTVNTLENGKEYKNQSSFNFNTVKPRESGMSENTKFATACYIGSDERSFSVIYQLKSKIGLGQDFMRTTKFSLSDDEKQMILCFVNEISGNGNPYQVLVFDRN